MKPSSRNELINAIEETWTPGSECLFQIMERLRDTAEDLHVEKGEAVEETEQPTYFGVQVEENGILDDTEMLFHKGPIIEVNKVSFKLFVAE